MPWARDAVREAEPGYRRTSSPTDHVVPRSDDALHVQVAREERDDAVRDDLAVLNEDAPEVAHHRGVVADFEARADRDLVAAARDDLPCGRAIRQSVHAGNPRRSAHQRQERVPRECH